MKKIYFLFIIILLMISSSFAQRILLNEDFETSGFNADSLPTGWAGFNFFPQPNFPYAIWHVRDTSANFPGVNPVLHSRAYLSKRSISIPWSAGNPIADDYVFTPALAIQAGDSLIFWMLFGTPDTSYTGGVQFSNYIDSMQVGYSVIQDPAVFTKFTTLVSMDSANVFKAFKFNLSSHAGQTIFIGFRYYMNTSVDGLWCNIDSVFVGNRSAIGIRKISSNVPKIFNLYQNYPNPFNPSTTFQFDLPRKEFVNIELYNMMGQKVKTLVNEEKSAGSYKVDFSASELSSGTYLYRITAGDYVRTNKMVLVK